MRLREEVLSGVEEVLLDLRRGLVLEVHDVEQVQVLHPVEHVPAAVIALDVGLLDRQHLQVRVLYLRRQRVLEPEALPHRALDPRFQLTEGRYGRLERGWQIVGEGLGGVVHQRREGVLRRDDQAGVDRVLGDGVEVWDMPGEPAHF